MRVLITGSSGYLGKSFIQEYQRKYHFQTFSKQKESLEKLNISSIDVVVHCAALVHQKKELPYKKYYDINTLYPTELAKKAKAAGVRQFIFISTIAVYDPKESFINQETEPKPKTSYGKSKYEAEKQLLALQDDQFDVVIIRTPMIYGKNAPGNIDTLIKLIRKVCILPFGKINNQRSFIYIKNITSVIDQAIQNKTQGVLLVADKESISTTKLISSLAKSMNKRVWLIRIPMFETILKKLKPKLHSKLYDNLKIENNLEHFFPHYQLPYTIETGINESIS